MKTKKIITLALAVILLFTMIACQDTTNEANVTENEIASNETQDKEDTTILEETVIIEAMNDVNSIIVDTRLNDSYNGWNLDGKPGHLEGSVDFSYNWLSADDDLLIKTLNTKGITSEKNIILYDTDLEHAKKVQTYLENKDFKSVTVFDLNQWSGELVQYENYKLIVPAQIVKSIVDGEKPETFESAGTIKIVEASWGEAKNSYDNGHIPTAFHINTDAVEPPPEWTLASDDVLLVFLLAHGFESTDTVIVTGEEQMAAYRVATVLRYLGVSDVRVLNGGTKAWTDAGYDLETDSNPVVAVESFGAEVPANTDMIETLEELQVSLNDPSFTLVDNRTWEEHIGESSGYSYHDKMGRIPGAVFGYAGFENSYSMSYFRNPDNTMRRPEEFIALWEANGIDVNNRLAFMCGSGWRAAEVLYYADVYGLDSISLYSDGWIGWSNNGLPTESGE
jgi:thiosulfate/3-mercaptopyruvate sulfurtransferase